MAKTKKKRKRKKRADRHPAAPDLRTLERRVAQLEERLARASQRQAGQGEPEDAVDERSWAVAALHERVAAPGGVVLAGAVDLPDGAHVDWQRGTTTADLLDGPCTAAERLAALAHPLRIELLRQVLLGVRSTAALTDLEAVGTSGQLYHHLRPLLAAGWLRQAARGRYEVPADRVVPLLAVLAATGGDRRAQASGGVQPA